MSPHEIQSVSVAQVERAIKLTYAQMMLNAIFGASTGGMFLIGFALDLGADNILLGLMSTVPQFFVIFQLLAAYFIERGFSRKHMTVIFSFMTPPCWFLIAAIPFFAPVLNTAARLGILIGVICLVTLASQFSGNARSSWIGELIPAGRRGQFFGYCALFAGVVGALFAVLEGKFLDFVRSSGLLAFTALFFFGAVFGLMSAGLNIPQPDCPLPGGTVRSAFLHIVRDSFRNRPLVLLALVNAVIALGNIAGPFGAAYCLRDVGVSFFGLGVLNSIFAAAMLAFSPLFGKWADRFGCRPILILGLLLLGPCGFIWLFIPPQSPSLAYACLPWANFVSGIGAAAMSMAISTLIYKQTKPEGRSVSFALYNVFVTLVSAPMPLLGGWLVFALERAGLAVDLRVTFYLGAIFIFLAAGIAIRYLQEPESVRTRALVFTYFPNEMARFWETAVFPYVSALIRFQLPARKRPEDQPPDGKS